MNFLQWDCALLEIPSYQLALALSTTAPVPFGRESICHLFYDSATGPQPRGINLATAQRQSHHHRCKTRQAPQPAPTYEHASSPTCHQQIALLFREPSAKVSLTAGGGGSSAKCEICSSCRLFLPHTTLVKRSLAHFQPYAAAVEAQLERGGGRGRRSGGTNLFEPGMY